MVFLISYLDQRNGSRAFIPSVCRLLHRLGQPIALLKCSLLRVLFKRFVQLSTRAAKAAFGGSHRNPGDL